MADPIVNFDLAVDLSGGVTGTARPVPGPASPPPTYLRLRCDKTAFFGASGFAYRVATDASGVVRTVVALGASNVQAQHVQERAGAANTSWQGAAAAGNVFDLSFSFQGVPKSVVHSVGASAALLPGEAQLGSHVMLLATSAVGLRPPSALDGAFGAAHLGASAAALDASIAQALRAALAPQACQDAMFQALLQANGPLVQDVVQAGASVTASLPYAASIAGMTLALNITSLALTVAFDGEDRALVLHDVPLWVRLE